ncbi:ankyrin repeat domain-containing protein 24-like [Corticium candelabrum]|uniref:ankyrin repeat domain-containing protein 24-like n=1 Tax=Corticium candelabrum TaxID=121492 RepID=UPI002E25D5DF|nr:ankyrin repeat domain-containing protein 24-like [Corticium candelabrum]
MKRFARKKKSEASEWTKHDDRLILAAQSGDISKLKTALKKGAGPNKMDVEGRTPLQMASMTGHDECVELLVVDNEGINTQDSQGRSALVLAARGGHIRCVELLLKRGADVILPDNVLMTALHYAASGGHIDCLKLLLEYNAKLAAEDKDGRTPLLLAAINNQAAVCLELIDRHTQINSTDNCSKTALMHAAENGSHDCVDILLKKGANRDLKDSSGLTAGDFAQQSAHYGIVKILEEAPVLASWNVGRGADEDGASDDEDAAPEDMVSKFESQDEPAVASLQPLSSVATTALSYHTATTQSKSSGSTVDQIKELEEENEMLNQDRNELQQKYAAVAEKLKQYEESGGQPSSTIQTDESWISARDDKQIEKLRQEIKDLKSELRLAHRDKETLQDKVDTLEIQVTSFMPDSEEVLDTDEEMDFQEGEDFDLPGMEMSPDHRTSPVKDLDAKAHKSESHRQISQLRGQIATLRLENERLKDQIKYVENQPNSDSQDSQIMKLQTENADLKDRLQELGGDTPTVPLDVYQQLKEAQEVEIITLKEEVEDLKQQKSKQDTEVNRLESRLHQQQNQTDSNRANAEVIALQQSIRDMQRQMQERENHHNTVVNNYRSHLLSAVQGRMASEVQSALFGIINLRSNGQLDDVLTADIV